jgi:hypothetical protein
MAGQIRNILPAHQIRPTIVNPFCNYPTLTSEITNEINNEKKVVDTGTPSFLNGDSRTFITEARDRQRRITRQGEIVCINRTTPIKLRGQTELNRIIRYAPADIPVFKYEKTDRSSGPNKMPQYGKINSAIQHNGKVIGYYVDLINFAARNYGAPAMGERVPIAWTHIGKVEANRPTNLSANFEELLNMPLPPSVTSGWGRKTRKHTKKMRKTRKGRRV